MPWNLLASAGRLFPAIHNSRLREDIENTRWEEDSSQQGTTRTMQNYATPAQKIVFTANRLASHWPKATVVSITAALESIADKRPALFAEIILMQHERDQVPAIIQALDAIRGETAIAE
jgi:hypothetical protein